MKKKPTNKLRCISPKVSIFRGYKNTFILALIFSIFFSSSAQNTLLDSLKIKLERTERAANFNESDIPYLELLNKIGSLYLYKDVDSLYFYSKKAFDLCEKANFIDGTIIALTNLSHYKFYKGQNSASLGLLNKSLAIAKKNNNDQLAGNILNQIGLRYGDVSNHSEALKSYLQAIEIGKKIGNKALFSIVKENIALLYVAQKDYQQALEIYKEVAIINKELDNDQFIGETKCNIADLYLKLKDFENASLNVDESILIFENNNSFEWLSSAYKTKGDIYLKQNNPNLALYWYDKSLVLHENLNDDIYKAPLLNSIAKANCKLKNYSEGEIAALNSLEISEKLSLLEIARNSYYILFQIKKEDKLSDDALKYHEKYKLFSDSVSRKENLNSLGNLKTKLEFDKQQKDAAIANDKALAKQNVYIYIFLIGFLILGFIIFLLRKQSRARKGFNTILRLKTKALEKREEELSAINNTKDKLFSIIGHDLRGPISALASILQMLKDKDIDQEEFSKFIPKVSNDVDAISFTLNNLLSWGRTQISGSTSDTSTIYLKNLIDDNIKLLDETAKKKKIIIHNNVSSEFLIWADRNHIDVVIRNLLSNAIKFTHKNGEIIFSAFDKQEFIEIEIKDNGIGMDTEFTHQIFSETSELVSTYGTANEKGTGLGLTLCKEMVLKNEGKIWVESTVAKGTTFYFTLPKKAISA